MIRLIRRTTVSIFAIASMLMWVSMHAQAQPSDAAKTRAVTPAEALEQQGITEYNTGEFLEALASWQRALDLRRKDSDKPGEEKDLGSIGQIYIDLAQYDKALESFQQVLTLGGVQDQEKTLADIGIVYLFLGQYDKALEYDRHALAVAKLIGDKEAEEQDLGNIGNVYEDLAEYDSALNCNQQAIAIATTIGDQEAEMEFSANLGVCYLRLSKYFESITNYQNALRLSEMLGDREAEGFILSGLASDYTSVGAYNDALDLLSKSREIAGEIADRRQEATDLDNLGHVCVALKLNHLASQYLHESLSVSREIGDKPLVARALIDCGEQSENLGERADAVSEYRSALNIYDSVPNPDGAIVAICHIVVCRRRSGMDAENMELVRSASAAVFEITDSDTRANAFTHLGAAYHEVGLENQAAAYLNESASIYMQLHETSEVADVMNALMVDNTDRNRPSLSILYGKQAVNSYQLIRQDISGLDKEIQELYVESHTETYRILAQLLIDRGRLPEAQQVLDLLKEEEFGQLLRRSGTTVAETANPVSQTPSETIWADRMSRDGDQLTAAGATMTDLEIQRKNLKDAGQLSTWTPVQEAELEAARADVEAANRQLQVTLTQVDRAFADSSRQAAAVPSFTALQGTLRTLNTTNPGVLAVYTLVTDKALYLLVVSPDVVVTKTVTIDQVRLNTLVNDLRSVLQNPRLDPRPAARALYDVVFAPIRSNVDAYHAHVLMWSLDGALRFVPIAALYDGSHYIAENYATDLISPESYPYLTIAPLAHWTALAAGVSKAHGGFPALGAVPAELRSVVKSSGDTTGALQGDILMDDKFTQSALADALADNVGDVPDYPVVHIASHFDLDPANGDASALLLGDGTMMSLSDLATMANGFQNVDLVTLSACNTGVGSSSSNGAEVDGCGMLVQRRGAKAVIATLWSIDDPSTAAIMSQFYRLHEEGVGKAEALRQAQLSLLGVPEAIVGQATITASTSPAALSGKASVDRGVVPMNEGNAYAAAPFKPDAVHPYAHPYYWAPFILMGNWK